MKSILSIAAFALAFTSPSAAQQPQTAAQVTSDFLANRITYDYIEPRTQKSVETYGRMKQRQVLEELKEFLSPLKLSRTLRLRTKQCFEINAYYVPTEWGLNICYEYFEWLDRIAPKQPTKEGFTREDVIVGGLVDAILHELGHAMFDFLNVPVFGREEDAADQMSGFLMLQFGKDVARTTIKGAAYTYAVSNNPQSRTEFSDEHGASGQRFYNYLCIAYGGDPDVFQDFVDKGLLPKERAQNCGREYKQVERAFVKTILPYIDQNLMKQVRAKQWLRKGDGK